MDFIGTPTEPDSDPAFSLHAFNLVWDDLIRNKHIIKMQRRYGKQQYSISNGAACIDALEPFFRIDPGKPIQPKDITKDYCELIRYRWLKKYKKAIKRIRKNKINLALRNFTRSNIELKWFNCYYLIPFLTSFKNDIIMIEVPLDVQEDYLQDLSIFDPEPITGNYSLDLSTLKTRLNELRNHPPLSDSAKRPQSLPLTDAPKRYRPTLASDQDILETANTVLIKTMDIIKKSREPGISDGRHPKYHKFFYNVLFTIMSKLGYVSSKEITGPLIKLQGYRIENEKVVCEVLKNSFFKSTLEEIELWDNKEYAKFWDVFLRRTHTLWAERMGVMIFNTPNSPDRSATPSFFDAVNADNITRFYCYDNALQKNCNFILPLPPFIKKGVVFLETKVGEDEWLSVQNPLKNVHPESRLNFIARFLSILYYKKADKKQMSVVDKGYAQIL